MDAAGNPASGTHNGMYENLDVPWMQSLSPKHPTIGHMLLGIEFAKEGAAVIVHAAPAASEGAAAEGAVAPAVRTAGLAPAA